MKYLKKSFGSMEPYFSKNIDDGIILNANEAPYAPPKQVLRKFEKELKKAKYNRYPDMQATLLRKALATRYGMDMEEITCGVGSDELLEVTFKAVLEPKDVVLSFSPSFSMYKVFADLALAEFREVVFPADLSFPVEEMLRRIYEEQPKIVLLCSPNNPTGAFLPRAEVIRIVRCTDALILLDLAYIDFADEDYTDLAKEFPNLIVFRTFSKAMALPSIRVGYALSCKENIAMINAVKAPYSVTSLSQILARIAMENIDLYKKRIEAVKQERERVYRTLKAGGFSVYPSKANFLYMELADEIYEALLQENIYIRRMKQGMARISIGLPEENDKLLKVVMKYAK